VVGFWFLPEAKASGSYVLKLKHRVPLVDVFFRARFASVLRLKPSEKSTRGLGFREKSGGFNLRFLPTERDLGFNPGLYRFARR
jgi:hypothetical protein